MPVFSVHQVKHGNTENVGIPVIRNSEPVDQAMTQIVVERPEAVPPAGDTLLKEKRCPRCLLRGCQITAGKRQHDIEVASQPRPFRNRRIGQVSNDLKMVSESPLPVLVCQARPLVERQVQAAFKQTVRTRRQGLVERRFSALA